METIAVKNFPVVIIGMVQRRPVIGTINRIATPGFLQTLEAQASTYNFLSKFGRVKPHITVTEECNEDLKSLVGDKICHDEANNELCQFDGGDCCLGPVDCTACKRCVCFAAGEPVCYDGSFFATPFGDAVY